MTPHQTRAWRVGQDELDLAGIGGRLSRDGVSSQVAEGTRPMLNRAANPVFLALSAVS